MIVGMMLAINANAYACSCAPPPPPQKALADSAAVFVGTVESIECEEGTKTVVLVVETAWKGVADGKGKLIVRTSSSGAACGFGFRERESYLVYAGRDDAGLSTNLCTRTRHLTQAAGDIEELNRIAARAPADAKPRACRGGCGFGRIPVVADEDQAKARMLQWIKDNNRNAEWKEINNGAPVTEKQLLVKTEPSDPRLWQVAVQFSKGGSFGLHIVKETGEILLPED